MLDQFKGIIGYTEEEFKELWGKAIFVVDTNVLLNFYKYTSKESTTSLLDILKKLKDEEKLWIPHQVALEYFFNYESNMFKQREGYNQLGSELKKLKENAAKTLRTVQSEHPYIITDPFHFYINDIEESNAKLQEQIKQEISNLPDSEEIRKDLQSLLDGVIGEPYSQDRIDAIEKDGIERYLYNVPPGFKDREDKKKENFRTYGDFRYQQLYGDLIVWNQMLDRAKNEEKPTSIIFITEERKEDWWEKEGNKIKRPQPQLIQEFYNKTKNNFYMYRTENFVKFAKEYLDASVTDEQVENVTKDVEHIRKIEDSKVMKENNFRLVETDKILEYLTENERQIYQLMLTETYGLPFDSTVDFANFINARKWAKEIAMPRIERKFQDLIFYLTSLDKEKGHEAQHIFYSLSDDTDERITILLEEIERVRKIIAIYDASQGGHL